MWSDLKIGDPFSLCKEKKKYKKFFFFFLIVSHLSVKFYCFGDFKNPSGWMVLCCVVKSKTNSIKLSADPMEGFTLASVEFGWGFEHVNFF